MPRRAPSRRNSSKTGGGSGKTRNSSIRSPAADIRTAASVLPMSKKMTALEIVVIIEFHFGFYLLRLTWAVPSSRDASLPNPLTNVGYSPKQLKTSFVPARDRVLSLCRALLFVIFRSKSGVKVGG